MTNEELRQRIIDAHDSRHEIFQDVDGFFYYWPEGHPHGCMAACHLRIIADELDKRNKPQEGAINNHTP